MKSLLWILFYSLCAAGLEDLLKSTPKDAGFSAKGLHDLDAAMQKHIDENKLAGVQTLIARDGKVVHFANYGKQTYTCNLQHFKASCQCINLTTSRTRSPGLAHNHFGKTGLQRLIISLKAFTLEQLYQQTTAWF